MIRAEGARLLWPEATSILDTQSFLHHFEQHLPLFYPAIASNARRNPAAFQELGELVLSWSQKILGDDCLSVLARGYRSFVLDVNRSQMQYEREGKYRNHSFEEVYQEVYGNEEHMQAYHWGVFTTTFAWEHHLQLYIFYRDYFLPRLGSQGSLLELGSGSGIWSMLLLQHLPDWGCQGIDISPTSVRLANQMSLANQFQARVQYRVADALAYQAEVPADAGLSCFVLEHLEEPGRLLEALARNLKAHSYSFVTVALTAAEVDHITEFRRESEVVTLAEDAGFRCVATLCGSPPAYPAEFKFLPRSMALVLQKRAQEIW